jgi:hypothetical protein
MELLPGVRRIRKAKGAVVEYAPRVQEDYGMKEFAVRNLDGYVLAFGENHDGKPAEAG